MRVLDYNANHFDTVQTQISCDMPSKGLGCLKCVYPAALLWVGDERVGVVACIMHDSSIHVLQQKHPIAGKTQPWEECLLVLYGGRYIHVRVLWSP